MNDYNTDGCSDDSDDDDDVSQGGKRPQAWHDGLRGRTPGMVRFPSFVILAIPHGYVFSGHPVKTRGNENEDTRSNHNALNLVFSNRKPLPLRRGGITAAPFSSRRQALKLFRSFSSTIRFESDIPIGLPLTAQSLLATTCFRIRNKGYRGLGSDRRQEGEGEGG